MSSEFRERGMIRIICTFIEKIYAAYHQAHCMFFIVLMSLKHFQIREVASI